MFSSTRYVAKANSYPADGRSSGQYLRKHQHGHVNNVHFEINVSLHASVPIRVFGVLQMLRVQQLVMLQGYESRFAIDMEGERSFREAVDGYESWARQNQAPDLLSQFGREVVESSAGRGFHLETNSQSL